LEAHRENTCKLVNFLWLLLILFDIATIIIASRSFSANPVILEPIKMLLCPIFCTQKAVLSQGDRAMPQVQQLCMAEEFQLIAVCRIPRAATYRNHK